MAYNYDQENLRQAHRRDKLKEYQSTFKQEKRKAGYKQCTVWIHESRLEEFKRFIALLEGTGDKGEDRHG